MPDQVYQSKRDLLRAQLAVPFTGYHNPAKDLILGLRRAFLKHAITPEDAMHCWLAGEQPRGMKRLPLPEVDDRSRALFHRLVAERDLAQGAAAQAPSEKDAWWANFLGRQITEALNLVALQMVDPFWTYGPNLVDIPWPDGNLNHDFTKNGPEGYFYASCFAALSNQSYMVVYGRDDRLEEKVKHGRVPQAEVEAEAEPTVSGIRGPG